MKQIAALLVALTVSCAAAMAADRYKIEVADNDETFIINGALFKAQTYCIGWDKGDQVIFLDGSALGVCNTAELYNLNRKQKCSVRCE